ncbi:hypothetical protein PVA45_05765 [Entomospira entomophila]|uniref:Adenine DNA glycosylase n=1 Tax=Entomospira entomophila TaxID=2719988 RepID=A0A968GCB8_9SPIO|nr:hypothetical protein [Entomospira entomophilus]NIZ41003.1 hypothetical protein [Entomospira entomophilus]WDI35216.1 hypothetical protein PVA45_05765 [Entomospira entomophilus]
MQELIAWFHSLESLPWKNDHDPYKVYILEIISQQTTVSVMTKRYQAWLERFPTIESIAISSEEAVLLAWEGLGYYQRARNIYEIAKFVTVNGFPDATLNDWLKLPGVGRYTAAAILSRAYNKPYLAVDVNVKRIIMRVLGVETYHYNLEKTFISLLGKDYFERNAGDINQALIRLGQSLCKKRTTECQNCPLWQICQSKGKTLFTGPVNRKKIIKQEKYVIIIEFDEEFYTEKIEDKIGRNLYRLPSISHQRWLELSQQANTMILTKRKHSYTRYQDTLYPLYIHVIDQDELQNFSDITVNLVTCNKVALLSRPFLSSYRLILDELIGGSERSLFFEKR